MKLRLPSYNGNRAKLAAAIAFSLVVYAAAYLYFGGAITALLAPFGVLAVAAYRIHIRRLERKNEQLVKTNKIHIATVEALATAIDAHDQSGSSHVRRMQIYSVGLGRAVGMSRDEVEALRTAALLHDIGKLAVPDHILNKGDELTPIEFEKTKIHSTVGAAILNSIQFESPVAPAVRSHHENWDGTGYPDGLAGELIPLSARIIAIADAYDTSLSARSMFKVSSRKDAREVILQGAGKLFDPVLAQVFLKHLTAFEAEIEEAGLSYEAELASERSGHGRDSFVFHIKEANREANRLFEIAREFGSVMNIQDTLAMFAGKVAEFVPFDTCAIYLVDDTYQHADAVYVEGENAEVLGLRRIRIGEGATGFVLKHCESVKNVNPDLDFAHSLEHVDDEYTSMVSLPLMSAGELLGAISVYSKKIHAYCDEHVRLLETVSQLAADAIYKSRSHEEARAFALTDPMTGLPNERSLRLQFDREVARAERHRAGFQVVMLDLDGFKAVNDSFGHQTGDEMLYEITQVILGQLREYDFLARYGGDEFVALIPETDNSVIMDVCDRIEKAVGEFELIVNADKSARVGVSIGAAYCADSTTTFEDLISAADRAMYQQKKLRKLRQRDPRVSLPAAQLADVINAEGDPHIPQVSAEFVVELDETHVVA
ncbi:MAG: diguanylate cyclase [Chloracidobacterium sp.]|nr:diguanylate cyclase [Chloracidobacterium sp.]MCC6825280.1 diguanylate cyclase [Acidobacteriota bacterium]MCO5332550.1 diguanylate cyclase [Pyrinomonadaceae bacterium]